MQGPVVIKKIMILFFILSVICLSPRISFSDEIEKRPLNISDIERLLTSGVISNEVIVKLIAERGIDFTTTKKDIDNLRALAANDDVVKALRQASDEYEKKLFGDIYVESDPPGAKVFIDGFSYEDKTPLRIEKLPLGNKKLIVYGIDGYGKFDGEITIKPAKTISLKVQLPKLPQLFSIIVNTDVPLAQLYLTGKEYQRKNIGITEIHEPIIVENLNQGEYVLEVEKEGYLPIKEKIYLDENKKFNYTLEKAKAAFLTVRTRPSAAEVYINENFKGISPLTLEIKTGSHMITAKKDGYKDGIRLVYLKDKEHKEIDIIMREEISDILKKAGADETAIDATRQLSSMKKNEREKLADKTNNVIGVSPISIMNLPRAGSPVPADDVVFVRGGCFQMGSMNNNEVRSEKLLHEVCVEDFYMGKFEVTQGLWKKVMNCNPAKFQEGDDYPVENVSWDEVQQFVTRLSEMTGMQYRLPTEAEWEYACRNGGKNTIFPWGEDKPVCQFKAKNGAKFDDKGKCNGTGTEPVGSYAPNELGLYDMSGNVYEWVQDFYVSQAHRDLSRNNPTALGDSPLRVEKGGSWVNEAVHLRCSSRDYYSHGDKSSVLGFRLVMTK